MNIYLAGCGKLGLSLGKELQNDGHCVTGLKRQAITADFPLTTLDLADRASVLQLPLDAQVIVFTVTPSEFSEAGYRQVYETVLENMIAFAKRHTIPPLFILVSSTGVYGQQDGQWVNENSATEPTSFSGRWVLRGEQTLQKQLSMNTIVRFSGIYGLARNRLIVQAQRGEPCQAEPPIWTNRIHEDDCVGVLRFLINQYNQGQRLLPIYLASDDTPVSSYTIRQFISRQLGLPPVEVKTENLSKQCNKRCDNNRLKKAGYAFIYPTYQAGYADIVMRF